MIIGTKRVYFRYDPSEELYGVVPGVERRGWNSSAITNIPTRKAPDDLDWCSAGFTDAIIKKSTSSKNSELNVVEENKSDSEVEEITPNDIAQFLANDRARRNNRRRSFRRRRIQRPSQEVSDSESSDVESDVRESEPATTIQVPDDHVWNLISRLGWVDRDEIVRHIGYLRNRIDLQGRRDLLGGMLRLMIPLTEAFSDIAPVQALNEESQKNFFFHLIGKGQHFYEFVLQTPDISLYLLENKVQDLYSMLVQST